MLLSGRNSSPKPGLDRVGLGPSRRARSSMNRPRERLSCLVGWLARVRVAPPVRHSEGFAESERDKEVASSVFICPELTKPRFFFFWLCGD